MNKALLTAASLILALLIAGCGGEVSESDLIGSWEGETDFSSSSGSGSLDFDMPGMDVIDDMLDFVEIPLELKDDHTFSVTSELFPEEGTWEYKDMKVTLTYTKKLGMDIAELEGTTLSKPLVLTVSKNGSILEGVEPGSELRVVFTKVSD